MQDRWMFHEVGCWCLSIDRVRGFSFLLYFLLSIVAFVD